MAPFERGGGIFSGMATTKEQFEEVNRRLSNIEALLPIRGKTKGWWALKWEWTKAHKATVIPVAAIVVAVLGWIVNPAVKHYLAGR